MTIVSDQTTPEQSTVTAARFEVRALNAGYGDILAVRNVSLSVAAGEATVVLGPNGAGKSTLLLALAGVLKGTRGSITMDGEDLSSLPAHRRTGHGLALVEQGKRIFHQRTVEENLRLGGTHLKRAPLAEAIEQAYERFPILLAKRKSRSATLSGGQQQMLAIAQALIPGPKILMLDEPSAGLAPVIVNELVSVVRQLKAEGVGVLLVEQLVEKALSVADQVLVLETGRVAFSGPASAVTADTLHDAYFSAASNDASELTT